MPEARLATGVTLREAARRLTAELAAAGIEGPERDARLLVAAAIGGSTADLLREPLRQLDAAASARLAAFADQRVRERMPVSRILGEREFYGRTFRIDAATLDPRPCTETVIEAALEIAAAEGWMNRPIRILDIGTGSGALLVTLLAELPLATGLGTDISAGALAIAADNAGRLGVGARAAFARHDFLADVAGPFDLVVANPPYIATAEISTLAPEVVAHDPVPALDGGVDGLTAYRRIGEGLHRVMPAGVAILEVGAGQAAAVATLLATSLGPALRLQPSFRQDLGGHTRSVALWTQAVNGH